MILPVNENPFTREQLGQLDGHVRGEYPELVSWAADFGMPSPLIRSLALCAAWRLAQKSQQHERDFRSAVERGLDLHAANVELGYSSPIANAARAAGLAVKASVYVRWYDLKPQDFTAELVVDAFQAYNDPRSEPLDRAVGSAPKELGFVSAIAQSFNHAAIRVVYDEVAASADALDRFLAVRPPVSLLH